MEADSSSATPDRLLADLEWLGKLARRLVSDPDLADDACQEAWLLASRRASESRFDRRRLVQFLRSYVWRTRRSNQRRMAREASVARPDRLPSTEELLLIGERQQELWRHLSELPEPYRSALLLHFQQGVAATDLAQRAGLAVDTVRWRLRRGLQLLKQSLEREEDGLRLEGLVPVAVTTLHRWRPSLAAGATATVSVTVAKLGTLLMTKNLLLALGTMILLVLGWTLSRGSELDPLVRPVEADSDRLESRAAPPTPRTPAHGLDPGESDKRLPVSTANPDETPVPQKWSLDVTVLQPEGRLAAGVDVMLTIGSITETLGVTDDEGRLVCPLPSLDARGLALWDTVFRPSLFVSHPRFASVEHELPIQALETPGVCSVTITLPGGACLRGRVLGASGNPLKGALCILWAVRPGESPGQLNTTLSNTEGRFALQVEPGARGFVMVESSSGRACTPTFDIGVAADLEPLYIDELATLSGRVLDPNGQPVQGAQIQFQQPKLSLAAQLREDGSFLSGRTWGSTSTDVHGHFEYPGIRPGTYIVRLATDAREDGGILQVELPCADVVLTTPHPRLRVLVRDVNGVAASGRRVHMRAIDAPLGDSSREWFRATDEFGAFSANVTLGTTYVLVVPGRFGNPVEQVVRIPETGFQHEAQLVIGESSRACSLRVELVEPGGGLRQDFSVLLRTLPSYLNLEEEERSPGPEGLLSNLPEGRFSVKLTCEIDPSEDQYLFLDEDEQTVELSPDVTSEVRFELQQGGHLEVFLDVGRWPDGSSTCPPDSDRAGKLAWLQEYGVVIHISEGLEGGAGSTAEFPHKLSTFDEHRPWSWSERWAPGTVTRNWSVLEPGRYAYRVSGNAWYPVEGVIEVQPGRTTSINVALDYRTE